MSPRPHDTGMVTMATQRYSEFALHARAILGYDLHFVVLNTAGASAAFKSPSEIKSPMFKGVEDVFKMDHVDLRIFSKPNASRGRRRMAVVLANGDRCNWKKCRPSKRCKIKTKHT